MDADRWQWFRTWIGDKLIEITAGEPTSRKRWISWVKEATLQGDSLTLYGPRGGRVLRLVIADIVVDGEAGPGQLVRLVPQAAGASEVNLKLWISPQRRRPRRGEDKNQPSP